MHIAQVLYALGFLAFLLACVSFGVWYGVRSAHINTSIREGTMSTNTENTEK